MKMDEAMEIMKGTPAQAGYMVHFEKVVGRTLESGYFPDVRAGEPPIETEEEAWQLAQKFAAKTRGKYINIYVIRRENFAPVLDYSLRQIVNR